MVYFPEALGEMQAHGAEMATLYVRNFPTGLHRKLKARAKREHRSISQEVTVLLTQTLEPAPTVSILALRGLGKELWRGVDAGSYVKSARGTWR
jgi:plasmid stability protein